MEENEDQVRDAEVNTQTENEDKIEDMREQNVDTGEAADPGEVACTGEAEVEAAGTGGHSGSGKAASARG